MLKLIPFMLDEFSSDLYSSLIIPTGKAYSYKYLVVKFPPSAENPDCLAVLTALYRLDQLLLCRKDRTDHCYRVHLLEPPSPNH